MQELNLDVAGEFLVMAATLIHIKSRMLLPRPDPAQEDPEEDPREALVRRLLEHQKYKAAAELLHERETLRERAVAPARRARRGDRRRGVRARARGRSLQPDGGVPGGARAREAAADGDAAAPSRSRSRRASSSCWRGSRRPRRAASRICSTTSRREGRPDRHVPGAAGDDPAEAGARVPGRRVRADPHLQARDGRPTRRLRLAPRRRVRRATTAVTRRRPRTAAADDGVWSGGRAEPGGERRTAPEPASCRPSADPAGDRHASTI